MNNDDALDTVAGADFDDWSDITLDGIEDEATGEGGTEAGEDTAAQSEPETKADQPGVGGSDGDGQAPPASDMFTLKHLDETKTVNKEEVISLAQRGLDYDRVRAKLNDANERLEKLQGADEKLEFFKALADGQGKTLDEFIEAAAATVRAQEKNIGYDEALRDVRFEFEKRRFAKEKDEWQRKTEKGTDDAARSADIDEFMQKYPEAAKDPSSIPKEVWADVENSGSLVSAYSKYIDRQKDAKIEELTRELEQQKQQSINRQSSTGSQATDNASNAADAAFNALWND